MYNIDVLLSVVRTPRTSLLWNNAAQARHCSRLSPFSNERIPPHLSAVWTPWRHRTYSYSCPATLMFSTFTISYLSDEPSTTKSVIEYLAFKRVKAAITSSLLWRYHVKRSCSHTKQSLIRRTLEDFRPHISAVLVFDTVRTLRSLRPTIQMVLQLEGQLLYFSG